MSMLQQIQHSAQQVAEAIASVLGVEVTIVDDKLKRIAGTGRYDRAVGERLDQASAFAQVLRSGRGFVIKEPGKHAACEICRLRDDCAELAEVCCPINVRGSTVGIIALVAFSDAQRQTLLAQEHDLLDFITRMAELLASKISEQETVQQLQATKQQLETVMNSVQEGILAVDRLGRVVNLNTAAATMLDVKANEIVNQAVELLLPGLPLEPVIQSGRSFVNREFIRNANDRRLHFMVTAKPWFEGGKVRGSVVTLREMAEVRQFVSELSSQGQCYTLDMILGESPLLRAVKDTARKAAKSSTTVLIQGESGTGKELFARAIHCAGERKNKPFIAINCAAIPEALMESELFGYAEGAFTGAKRGGKPGKFELADGGTLFLDEIGDMSLALQAKLLRVLQERKVERVGGIDSLPVDVRIISATHKDLDEMVVNGEFRQDLYYRVNVFPLYIPALRERKDDLPLLIQAFLFKHAAAMNKPIKTIEAQAYQLLLDYDWPGNVRELENATEYMVNIEPSNLITAGSIPLRIKQKLAVPGARLLGGVIPLAELEKSAIIAAVNKFGATVDGRNQTVQALGISRATLYRKLKEYGLESQNEN